MSKNYRPGDDGMLQSVWLLMLLLVGVTASASASAQSFLTFRSINCLKLKLWAGKSVETGQSGATAPVPVMWDLLWLFMVVEQGWRFIFSLDSAQITDGITMHHHWREQRAQIFPFIWHLSSSLFLSYSLQTNQIEGLKFAKLWKIPFGWNSIESSLLTDFNWFLCRVGDLKQPISKTLLSL